MRTYHLIACMLLAACGQDVVITSEQPKPLPTLGVYDVLYTFALSEYNGKSHFSDGTEEPQPGVLEVAQESDDTYSVYQCDEAGTREYVKATSPDGFFFYGEVGYTFGDFCLMVWAFDFDFTYGNGMLYGNDITYASIPCATPPHTFYFTIEGVVRE